MSRCCNIIQISNNKVADAIVGGAWNVSIALWGTPGVSSLLESMTLPRIHLLDSLVWPQSTNGIFSFLTPTVVSLPWAELIWKTCIPHSHSFTLWRLLYGKMPMDENLKSRGCVVVSVCIFCMRMEEISSHLFLECPFVVELWKWVGDKMSCVLDLSSSLSLLDCVPRRCSSQVADLYVAAVVHTLHIIWLPRNTLRFSSDKVTIHAAKVEGYYFGAVEGP